jgi:beta-xylosidase
MEEIIGDQRVMDGKQILMDRQMNKQMNRQTNKQMGRGKNGQTDKVTSKQLFLCGKGGYNMKKTILYQ